MDARIRRCLEPGVSVIVGSVSAAGQPACCRAVGLLSENELQTARVFLPVATSGETIANLTDTGRLAVVTTHPIDHCATQLKGSVRVVRPARDDERDFLARHFESFGGVLNNIGYPPRLTRSVTLWPAVAVDFQVEEIFEQSPGPKAGTRLR